MSHAWFVAAEFSRVHSANGDNRNAERWTESWRVLQRRSRARRSRLNGSLHGLSIHSRTTSGTLSRLAISRENRFHSGSCRASRVTTFHASLGLITNAMKTLCSIYSRQERIHEQVPYVNLYFVRRNESLRVPINSAVNTFERRCFTCVSLIVNLDTASLWSINGLAI